MWWSELSKIHIGKSIKQARLRAGLTQADLAERLSKTQPVIARWESGRVKPADDSLDKIDGILGISSDSKNVPTALSTWLVKTRLSRGLSVAELSTKSSLSMPTIYALESGRISNPRQKTLGKLERALGSKIPADTAAETEQEATIEGLGELVGFDPNLFEDVPAVPGIYVLYDVSERPIYVGETKNIRQRLKEHREKFWFRPPIVETGAYIKIDDRSLRRKIETILIRFLKSNAVLNKQNVDR